MFTKLQLIPVHPEVLPKYPTLGVLLPLVGEADEVPALRNSRHCVPVLKAEHLGASCHQNATR